MQFFTFYKSVETFKPDNWFKNFRKDENQIREMIPALIPNVETKNRVWKSIRVSNDQTVVYEIRTQM